jgi:hypothetical protein
LTGDARWRHLPVDMRLNDRILIPLFLSLALSLAFTGACGKSAADIESGFQAIEKGTLATEVRDLLGPPERVESSPQIPDLEHWKYDQGRLTVSLLQGRVLGKFDTGPADPTLPVPETGLEGQAGQGIQ